MEKLARAMQIRFGGILRNAKQLRCFGNSCVEPIVQPQGRLVDLGKRLNALGEDPIALRRFCLPVRQGLSARRVIENRLVCMWTAKANPRFQVHRLVERDPVNP